MMSVEELCMGVILPTHLNVVVQKLSQLPKSY